MMKHITLCIALLSMAQLSAQNKWTVLAGNTPDPYYLPSQLTIEVGDTVEWINIEGFHDVTTTSGPEDFSFSPAGTGWTHEFVFTQPGFYEYECSVGNHAQTQFGSISVVEEQTTYVVIAGGTPDAGTPDPYFSPSQLTIQVGDTVIWENVEGFHDVTTTSGPEDFSMSPAGTGWTHDFVFTMIGMYEYECSVGNHALTQFGTITVEDVSAATTLLYGVDEISIYPNPTSSTVNIELSDDVVLEDAVFHITDITGKTIDSHRHRQGDNLVSFDLSQLASGNYMISLIDRGQFVWSHKVVRN